MDKMMRSKKKFGRCRVEGHGCKCEATHDIQTTPCHRAEEKQEWAKEAIEYIDSMNSREFEDFLISCDKST